MMGKGVPTSSGTGSHERGVAFLLKIGNGVPLVYSTVAGLKTAGLSVCGDPVPVTGNDSAKRCELLSGAGLRSVSVVASGLFIGGAAEAQLRGLALGGGVADYQLNFESGERLQGRFLVSRLEYAGDFNGDRYYLIALESSGEVNVVSGG